MKRIQYSATIGALTILALMVAVVGLAGGSRRADYVIATGPMIGAGTAIGERPKCIWIAQQQAAGAATESLFRIWSPDLKNYNPATPLAVGSCDSIWIGGGGSFDECFPSRVDSAACVILGTGAEFAVWVE